MIELFVQILILGISAHALGFLIVNEEGPFDVLTKLRRFVGLSKDVEDRLDEGEHNAGNELNVLAKMFTCDICTSTAIGSILGILLLVGFKSIILWSIPAAIVGVALALKSL